MRSINEQTHSIKLSVNEALHLIELLEKTNETSIQKRLEELLSIFYHSKPNILDYPIEEWKNIEDVFKFCMKKGDTTNDSNRNTTTNYESNC